MAGERTKTGPQQVEEYLGEGPYLHPTILESIAEFFPHSIHLSKKELVERIRERVRRNNDELNTPLEKGLAVYRTTTTPLVYAATDYESTDYLLFVPPEHQDRYLNPAIPILYGEGIGIVRGSLSLKIRPSPTDLTQSFRLKEDAVPLTAPTHVRFIAMAVKHTLGIK